ncbi:MAG TPA: DNA repair protein RecN [Prolixibacteraceae bacterium]|nr:DNA repair protein RecN [Prolixibacteraceae bacterium]
MLSTLSIKNYAIIKNLNVNFDEGFCVITGETGAGKSIIMGALSLILGQRADSSVVNENEGKCVVEGRFKIESTKKLQSFFNENELDFDVPVILRREITTAGKSRAFVNDTPVSLNILRDLGLMLIDIHSQHSNLELGKHQFQLNVLDWYCGNDSLLAKYTVLYHELTKIQHQRNELFEIAEKAKADLDYFEFQFNQLNEANLTDGEQEELEQEQEILTHAGEIKAGLESVYQILDGDEQCVIVKAKEANSVLQRLKSYLPFAEELSKRLESVYIEMRDIADESELLAEKTEDNPSRLGFIAERINLIYTLQQKHRVESVAELITLRTEYDQKIQASASYGFDIERLDGEIKAQTELVGKASNELHLSREEGIKGFKTEVTQYLNQLGMPNAVFSVDLVSKGNFGSTGTDEVYFLFTANKAGQLEDINKVASGGELSRLMLSIKTVVAKSKALPAIIFDEIDTGISGEIAIKMGSILSEMAKYMQVINITHLPQIASKGMSHYQVYKNEHSHGVETDIKKLNSDERVFEIAKMLSGEIPHQSAIDNARSLLGFA